MTYDPSRKRKRAVPPQLRAWVYRRKKHDPKRVSMATGYGTVGKKPYRRGSRGGAAWSAGRTLRYDVPARKAGWHAKAKGALGKVENNLQYIGLALGILIPSELARAKLGTSLKDHYIGGTIYDTKRLLGVITTPGWGPVEYVAYKFTHVNSAWAVPFWGSLGMQIAARIGAFKIASVRVNTAIKKLTMGTLIASIIGGLFMQGCEAPTAYSNPSNPASNSTSTTTRTELNYYG